MGGTAFTYQALSLVDSIDTLSTFKIRLKTFLYKISFIVIIQEYDEIAFGSISCSRYNVTMYIGFFWGGVSWFLQQSLQSHGKEAVGAGSHDSESARGRAGEKRASWVGGVFPDLCGPLGEKA